MRKDFKTIVNQLRAAGLVYGMGKLPLEAADAIEDLQATARSFQEKLATVEVNATDEMVRADKAESERDRLKAALRLWQDAWATGRNEPMAIAANATKNTLGDAS